MNHLIKETLNNISDKDIVSYLIINWDDMDIDERARLIVFIDTDGTEDVNDEPELLVDEMKRELFEEAAQKYTLEQLHELLKI